MKCPECGINDWENKSGLRDLPANEWDYRVPADGLTFSSLAVMLSAAMNQGAPLSGVDYFG